MSFRDMQLFNEKFPRYLRTVRKVRRLTQQELSHVAQLDYKHLQSLESVHELKDPRISTIHKLSIALQVPTHDLIAHCFDEDKRPTVDPPGRAV